MKQSKTLAVGVMAALFLIVVASGKAKEKKLMTHNSDRAVAAIGTEPVTIASIVVKSKKLI